VHIFPSWLLAHARCERTPMSSMPTPATLAPLGQQIPNRAVGCVRGPPECPGKQAEMQAHHKSSTKPITHVAAVNGQHTPLKRQLGGGRPRRMRRRMRHRISSDGDFAGSPHRRGVLASPTRTLRPRGGFWWAR
jgi:hypothetical protein